MICVKIRNRYKLNKMYIASLLYYSTINSFPKSQKCSNDPAQNIKELNSTQNVG